MTLRDQETSTYAPTQTMAYRGIGEKALNFLPGLLFPISEGFSNSPSEASTIFRLLIIPTVVLVGYQYQRIRDRYKEVLEEINRCELNQRMDNLATEQTLVVGLFMTAVGYRLANYESIPFPGFITDSLSVIATVMSLGLTLKAMIGEKNIDKRILPDIQAAKGFYAGSEFTQSPVEVGSLLPEPISNDTSPNQTPDL